MKLIGILMLMTGCVGMGISARGRYYQRMTELTSLIHFFHYMESEVDYHKASMAEICRQGSIRMAEPWKTFLCQTGNELQSGDGGSFSEIWAEGIRGIRKESLLSVQETEQLTAFATEGFSDKNMQLTQIRLLREDLEKRLEELRQEAAGRGRLYVCLGSVSGLLLSIILL